MSAYRFRHPPRAIRKAKLDNLALVPASLLPFKEQYQQIANALPQGATLILLPSPLKQQRRTCEKVAANLRERGHRVMTLPVERFA